MSTHDHSPYFTSLKVRNHTGTRPDSQNAVRLPARPSSRAYPQEGRYLHLQKVARRSYSNGQDTVYKEGVDCQPIERRNSKWRKGLA